jgi:hypothetical protein
VVYMIKICYMQVWKCHNEAPYFVQLTYNNKKPQLSQAWIPNRREDCELFQELPIVGTSDNGQIWGSLVFWRKIQL